MYTLVFWLSFVAYTNQTTIEVHRYDSYNSYEECRSHYEDAEEYAQSLSKSYLSKFEWVKVDCVHTN